MEAAAQWRLAVATLPRQDSGLPRASKLTAGSAAAAGMRLECRIPSPILFKDGSRLALRIVSSRHSKAVHAKTDALDVDPKAFEEETTQGGSTWFDAFYRFSRPHTIIGTAIGVTSVSLLAIQNRSDVSWAFFVGLLQALVPALLMNIYIVGLNQIYDIEIDKVNKPYLPLASGEFSLATGVGIVVVSAVLSLGTAAVVAKSVPLLWALWVSLLLGTAYSVKLPFLRWKRSAVVAASCILSVRAVVVQLAFYLHMQMFVFRRELAIPWSLIFTTVFMCFFSVVIALFKDIPDLEGDKSFGIRSYTVRLGQKKVFDMCVRLLVAAYAMSVAVCSMLATSWTSKLALIVGHGVLGTLLWTKSRRVDVLSKSAISSFYMFIWKLFYAEYLLIPLMR